MPSATGTRVFWKASSEAGLLCGLLFSALLAACSGTTGAAGPAGVAKFTKSPSLLGDLGSSYVGHWVGDVITLGTMISAFGC